MPDVKVQLAAAITALAPVILPFLVYAVRLLIPKIPRVALPLVAMGLGFGVNALTAYIAGHTFDPIVGASLGAAAVFVREIYNTFAEHGANP